MPIKDTNVTARLQVEDFVVVDAEGEIRLPKYCVGKKPIVCDPAPMKRGEDTAGACVQAVILREEDVSEHCPVQFQVHPEGLVLYTVPNHIIIVTGGETIHEKCTGHDNQQSLGIGTYHVTWDGTCFLTTRTWSLAGVHSQQLERVVHHRWKPWDLIHFSLPNIIEDAMLTKDIHLPSRLSDPKTFRLNLLPTLPPLSSELNSEYHYFWFCLLIILIVVSIVLYRFKGKICSKFWKPKEPETPVEEGKNQPFRLELQTSSTETP